MGYSDAWPGGATPYHVSERLGMLLDAWMLEKATLVGMDMGGQPALVFAAVNPERVRSLIVMNSLVMWDEETSWEIKLLRRFGWNRLLIRRFPRGVFYRAERTSLPNGVHLPPTLRGDLWRGFNSPATRKFIVRMCAGYQGSLPRLPGVYSRITCPTLLLWGERDRHFPPAHARKLQEVISGSILSIIPGAEHWMAWHAADIVADHIMRFESVAE
jgi:pimeloyl-ACP methyl ester carboxylesterase